MITARLLLPYEFSLYRAHLQQLEPAARMSYFGNYVTDAWLAQHIAQLNPLVDVVVGAFTLTGGLLGAAHLSFTQQGLKPAAYICMSVLEAYRRQGYGGQLFALSLVVLRNRWVRLLYAAHPQQQAGFAHFLQAEGLELPPAGEHAVHLPNPTGLSYGLEFFHLNRLWAYLGLLSAGHGLVPSYAPLAPPSLHRLLAQPLVLN